MNQSNNENIVFLDQRPAPRPSSSHAAPLSDADDEV